jgi:hypothetical protein
MLLKGSIAQLNAYFEYFKGIINVGGVIAGGLLSSRA